MYALLDLKIWQTDFDKWNNFISELINLLLVVLLLEFQHLHVAFGHRPGTILFTLNANQPLPQSSVHWRRSSRRQKGSILPGALLWSSLWDTPTPRRPNRTQKTFPFRASLSNALSSPRTGKAKRSVQRLSSSGCSSLLIPTNFIRLEKPPKIPILASRGHINLKYEIGRWRVWECSGFAFLWTLSWHHSSYFLGARRKRVKATVTVRRVTTPPLLAATTESH